MCINNLSPTWKPHFQLEYSTTGRNNFYKAASGVTFKCYSARAVPGCDLACSSAQRDGEFVKLKGTGLKVTAVSDSQPACLLF